MMRYWYLQLLYALGLRKRPVITPSMIAKEALAQLDANLVFGHFVRAQQNGTYSAEPKQ
jgi:hypothetical protein